MVSTPRWFPTAILLSASIVVSGCQRQMPIVQPEAGPADADVEHESGGADAISFNDMPPRADISLLDQAFALDSTDTPPSDLPFTPVGPDLYPQGPHKIVFVTSGSWTGDLGGLDGADQKCQAAATAAGLSGVFKAWLSDSTTDAKSRLTHSTAPYRLPDMRPIANDWDDLIDGQIAHKLYQDEFGNAGWFCNCSQDFIRTGTDASGTKIATNDYYCDDYTSASQKEGPYYGRVAKYTNSYWTAQGDSYCHWPMRLACFEQ